MISDAIDLVEEEMPKFNPIMAEGLAYHQMRDTPKVINDLMMIALRSDVDDRLPEGFNYVGYTVLSPLEEYEARSLKHQKTNKSKRNVPKGYDLTINDTFMVNYNFHHSNGDKVNEIVRPILIPFVRRGGITHIRGVKYGISPVLKTRGISATEKGFFVEFQSSKVQFEWINHVFDINGQNQHVYMPYTTTLHHKASRTSTKFFPPVAAWLFGKLGPREVFKRYLDCDVEFYDEYDKALHDIDQSEYAICTGGLAVAKRKSNFAVVIPKDKLTLEAKVLIGSMFYVGRIHPDRLDISNVDSSVTWCLLLGIAITGDKGIAPQNLIADIRTHFNNIEQMMDSTFVRELLGEGIEVDDIYGLLFYIIRAFTDKDLSNAGELANLYGRYYTCIEYVTYDIRGGIYNARWDLINQATDQATRSTGNPVKFKSVQRSLNQHISTIAAQRINNNHGEVNAFMSTTDNMIIALTSHCIDQTDANKSTGKKSIDLNSQANHLHASFAEAGSVVNLPKARPIGPYRINMCVKTDYNGRVIESDKHKDIKHDLAVDIKQKGI